jgi:hypothetical protein
MARRILTWLEGADGSYEPRFDELMAITRAILS